MKGRRKLFKRKKTHQSRSLLIAVLGVVFLVFIAFIVSTISNQPRRLVSFYDRGETHVILTNATTVRDALIDAKITVEDSDRVEPSINFELHSTDSFVIIYRARPVLVIDGSFREKIMTPAQSPNEIATSIGRDPIAEDDQSRIEKTDFIKDGASTKLVIERAVPEIAKPKFGPTPQALTASKGAQLFVDSSGVAHRETYYDLPMNIVVRHCSNDDYSVRYDGAKIDSDGYVLVAANYAIYPKCSVVETSLGPGKVYDTGGFALRYPHGFDLATDWTNYNGR